MRHLGSLLLSLVLAPAIWVLGRLRDERGPGGVGDVDLRTARRVRRTRPPAGVLLTLLGADPALAGRPRDRRAGVHRGQRVGGAGPGTVHATCSGSPSSAAPAGLVNPIVAIGPVVGTLLLLTVTSPRRWRRHPAPAAPQPVYPGAASAPPGLPAAHPPTRPRFAARAGLAGRRPSPPPVLYGQGYGSPVGRRPPTAAAPASGPPGRAAAARGRAVRSPAAAPGHGSLSSSTPPPPARGTDGRRTAGPAGHGRTRHRRRRGSPRTCRASRAPARRPTPRAATTRPRPEHRRHRRDHPADRRRHRPTRAATRRPGSPPAARDHRAERRRERPGRPLARRPPRPPAPARRPGRDEPGTARQTIDADATHHGLKNRAGQQALTGDETTSEAQLRRRKPPKSPTERVGGDDERRLRPCTARRDHRAERPTHGRRGPRSPPATSTTDRRPATRRP